MLQSSLLATKWYPILTDSEPMSVLRFMAFWMTIMLVAGFALLILLFKGKMRRQVLRYILVASVLYASALGILFLVFTFLEDGITTILFVPILIAVLVFAACALLLAFKRNRVTGFITAIAAGLAIIAVLICLAVYYGKNISDDGYFNSDTASVNQIILYIAAVLVLAVIIALAFLCGRKDKKGFSSKSIAYAAVCIALSFALSYIRIFRMPQGGSVTLASLLPLMIYSYMFGTKKGVFAAFAYGLLQAVQDPWIIHPAQFLLDYPVAFAAIGLADMFAKVKSLNRVPQLQFALGAIVASALRYLSHVLSGVFAFAAYADGTNPWSYSLAYNSVVFVDLAIVIVVGILVFSSKSIVAQARKYNAQ